MIRTRPSRILLNRLLSILLVGLLLALLSLHAANAEPVQSSSANDPPPGQQSSPELTTPDEPPPADQARIIDQRVPAWETQYGTQYGLENLPPMQPVFEASPNGPDVPLGDWVVRSTGGTQPIVAIQDVPDGRVYVGLMGEGLRVYAPDSVGNYTWTSISAAAGGLASNSVNDLAYLDGKLYVATQDAGVSILTLSSGTWQTLNTSNSSIPANTVRQITAVAPAVGPLFLWFATSAGVAYFQPGQFSNLWTVYTTGNSGLISNNVNDVAVTSLFSSIVTWFATENGLSVLIGSTWTSPSDPACPSAIVRRIIADRSGAIWFIPYNTVPNAPGETITPQAILGAGVCRFSNGNWQLFNRTNFLPSNEVTDLGVDSAGRVWMSLAGDSVTPKGGGAMYDQGTWLVFQTPSAPLASDQVSRVLPAGEAVWFGHGNLPSLSVYSPYWQRYPSSEMGGSGNPGAILIDNNQTWVGSGNGLAWRDASTWHTQAIAGNTSPVTALERDGSGRLWIGTRNNGLYRYENATFSHVTTSEGLPDNQIYDILTDHLGRLWVATGAGLAMQSGNAPWMNFTTATSGLISDDLRALALDSADRLWIGTAANGISLYDLNSSVNPWSSQTSADGLPSNNIHALATDPSGKIWVATSAGLAAGSPGAWTVYTQANGALPSNQVVGVASDPLGRIWTGTSRGLAYFDGSAWESLHVSTTLLASDQPAALAADEKYLWAAADGEVSVRGVPSGPIGFSTPVVSSFTPQQAAPFTQVTINGSNFDARGPQYNQVQFGVINGFLGATAKVLSASSTQLVVEVPLLAYSGHIQVQANGLKVETSTDFQVLPKINALQPSCLGMGSKLQITGGGFNGNEYKVRVGNGDWRSVDYFTPTSISTFIRPGDTSGAVQVRITGGHTASYTHDASSPTTLSIANLQVSGYQVQQAIEGLQMVWGKSTLAQLKLIVAGGSCGATVQSGKVDWKLKNGTTQQAGFASPKSTGGDLITPGSGGEVSALLTWDMLAGPFSLAQFDGVRFTLKNGPVTLLTYDLPASAFNYIDPPFYRKFLNVPIVPNNMTDVQYLAFLSEIYSRLLEAGRVYPQQDTDIYSGWKSWQIISASNISVDTPNVNLDNSNIFNGPTFGSLQGKVEDLREFINDEYDAGIRQAMGVIAPVLYTPGTSSGKAVSSCPTFLGFGGDCNQNSAIAFANPDSFVHTWLQEVIHALGWVRDWSVNYDEGNEAHSKYDEGEWTNIGTCIYELNFRAALMNQLGVIPDVWYLNSWGYKKSQFSLEGCGTPKTMPMSTMAYTPARSDTSTFLEPIDYSKVLCHLINLTPSSCGTYVLKNGAAIQAETSPLTIDLAPAVVDADQTLRLNGSIDLNGVVTVRMSYLLDGTGQRTPEDPDGEYHLRMLDAGNTQLLDYKFSVGTGVTHGAPLTDYPFSLRVSFPTGTHRVEIVHNGQTLWSKTISASAPTISVITPGTGSGYVAPGPMYVSWSASDPDGDPLRFSIQYSPDDGISWLSIEPATLTSSPYLWVIGMVPGTRSGRIKVTASDGFHTTSAISQAFSLTARPPKAVIISPKDSSVFDQGETIGLSAFSLSANGPEAASYAWTFDGMSIGSGRILSYVLDTTPGNHTIELQVSDGLGSDMASVNITVTADYDRDGLPDSYELAHRLNPLNFEDAAWDTDNDGLSNRREYELGTDPNQFDTDGDGYGDGVEVLYGMDPLNREVFPTIQLFLPYVNRGGR